jgi:hypothetical protein
MRNKAISIITASIVAVVFMLIAMRPGVINMIGFGIYQTILSKNSPTSIKYERAFIYLFDIFLSMILFWLVYKIVNRILK